jgi:hypothetical protein
MIYHYYLLGKLSSYLSFHSPQQKKHTRAWDKSRQATEILQNTLQYFSVVAHFHAMFWVIIFHSTDTPGFTIGLWLYIAIAS